MNKVSKEMWLFDPKQTFVSPDHCLLFNKKVCDTMVYPVVTTQSRFSFVKVRFFLQTLLCELRVSSFFVFNLFFFRDIHEWKYSFHQRKIKPTVNIPQLLICTRTKLFKNVGNVKWIYFGFVMWWSQLPNICFDTPKWY